MPLGAYPLGLGPLGHDPVGDPSEAGVRQAQAPLIHPGSRDAVLLSTGALQCVHPVDQAVCLALGIERGGVGSVPGQGHTLRQMAHLGRDLEVQVRQRVELAFSTLTSRRDVALLSVVTTRVPGGFTVEVAYRNLRLAPDPNAASPSTTLRVSVT